MPKPGDDRRIALPTQGARLPIAKRSEGVEQIKKSLEKYASSDPARIKAALIVASGMAGKTTFIKNDVMQLFDSNMNGFNNSDKYQPVYIECDTGGMADLKTKVLLGLFLELGRAGFQGGRFAFALSRLNTLRKNALKKSAPQLWQYVETACNAFEAYSAFPGAASVSAGINVAISSIAPLLSLSELSHSGKVLAQKIRSSQQETAPIAWVDSVYRALVSSMSAEQIEEGLELLLITGVYKETAQKACIILDGIESLVERYATSSGEISWLTRLVNTFDAFFILSGRRGVNGFPRDVISLGAISKSEYNNMLKRSRPMFRRAPRSLDDLVYERAKELPGVLALYAIVSPSTAGFGGRKLAEMIRKKIEETPSYLDHSGTSRSAGIDEIINVLIQTCACQMEPCEWQLVAWLVWFGEWDAAWIYRLLPETRVYSENICFVKDLPFIESMGKSKFRFHSLVLESVRNSCSRDTMAILASSLEQIDRSKPLSSEENEGVCAALESIAFQRIKNCGEE